MKKLLLSSVALAGLTAGAMAADLPSRRAPAPYVAVPVFTWTGFYIGANAGYGFGVGNNGNNGIFIPPGTFAAPAAGVTGTLFTNGGRSRDGFVGGGQIGYNYQIGNLVLGIEADAQYADLSSNRNGGTVFVPAGAGAGIPAAFVGGTVASGIDYFGTVRGRIGYAFDRLLVYGTGGFAYGEGPNPANFGFGGRGGMRTGYTGGGGVEYAFTPNLTAKVEALYVNLEANRNNGFIGVIGATPVFVANTRRLDSEFVVVRAGINYKFNSLFGL